MLQLKGVDGTAPQFYCLKETGPLKFSYFLQMRTIMETCPDIYIYCFTVTAWSSNAIMYCALEKS
jgi:hypothetical protein